MDAPAGRAREVGLFAVMAVAWGSNYLFVKLGLDSASPLWLAFFRAASGAVVLLPFVSARGSLAALDRRGRWHALLLGVPNTAVFLGLWFVAAGSVSVGLAAVVIYTYPIWIALFSAPLLGVRLTPLHGASVAAGFAGIFLVSEPWNGGPGHVGVIPFVELAAAAVSWAVATLAFQRRFSVAELPAANAFQLLGGSAVLLVAASLTPGSGPVHLSGSLVESVLWLGPVGTALAYGIWFWLLGRRPAAVLSAYLFVVPVVALASGVAFTAETVSLGQVAGATLVVASIYAVARASSSGTRVPSPASS